jgi:hypothetical protein
MKRRVVLAGLGTASIGVGTAFGSGAFTSIEANRNVELNVKGDSSAQIKFRKGEGTGADRLIATDESNAVDVIKFTQTNLNEQSTTTFKRALEIENNTDESGPVSAAGSGLTVDLYVQERDDGGIGDDDGDVLDFRVEDGDGTRSIVKDGDGKNAVQLPATGDSGADTAEIDIVVDLRGENVTDDQSSDDNDLEAIEQIVFVVEAVDDE